MASLVYVACALTSGACAWLLVRAHRREPSSVLRWSAVCFVLLAINNVLLVIDLALLPDTVDLAVWRNAVAMLGLLALLFGLLRDARPRTS